MSDASRSQRMESIRKFTEIGERYGDDSKAKHAADEIRWLLDEAETMEATLERIRDLHRPFAIYDACNHEHGTTDEVGVVNIDDIGLTCAKMYDVCRRCCRCDTSQSEECMAEHDHGPDKPICATSAILTSSEGTT